MAHLAKASQPLEQATNGVNTGAKLGLFSVLALRFLVNDATSATGELTRVAFGV